MHDHDQFLNWLLKKKSEATNDFNIWQIFSASAFGPKIRRNVLNTDSIASELKSPAITNSKPKSSKNSTPSTKDGVVENTPF